jgi:sulfide:quinone oxidoreductase
MSRIVVVGAGLGGVPAAYEIRGLVHGRHDVLLVNASSRFHFVPSNPWVAVGWRRPEQVSVDLAPRLDRRGVGFIAQSVTGIDPLANALQMEDGSSLAYDFLVLTTGPALAFDEVPGLGRAESYAQSICTLEHATQAHARYEELVDEPGPVVIGAVQDASCFVPAYEMALIIDADLRKRRLRDKVPMTFVTAEPYIGHLGLGGVGDSKGMLEAELRRRHIAWITSASVEKVVPNKLSVREHDEEGEPIRGRDLDFAYSMLLPAFRGVEPVAAAEGLSDARGFVIVDEHQRSPVYPNIYAAGVCVAIPAVERTPVPTGAPKTGYMIESMVSAVTRNIAAELAGDAPAFKPTWNAICLADLGDTGLAFVALPEIPPRNVTWAKKGKWVRMAKAAYEKYFLHQVRSGNTDPIYERYVLEALGIERLQPSRPAEDE